ncbi:MAG: hypothetical protein JWM21_112 [Acidobacteria bacterium]|nr:hypothetical protein [Acidobacteriota bacterium]
MPNYALALTYRYPPIIYKGRMEITICDLHGLVYHMDRTVVRVPVERVENAILLIRGEKVILDADLAALYGIATKRLKEQVRRNRERFPEDFMFELTADEQAGLQDQIGASKLEVADCDLKIAWR